MQFFFTCNFGCWLGWVKDFRCHVLFPGSMCGSEKVNIQGGVTQVVQRDLNYFNILPCRRIPEMVLFFTCPVWRWWPTKLPIQIQGEFFKYFFIMSVTEWAKETNWNLCFLNTPRISPYRWDNWSPPNPLKSVDKQPPTPLSLKHTHTKTPIDKQPPSPLPLKTQTKNSL